MNEHPLQEKLLSNDGLIMDTNQMMDPSPRKDNGGPMITSSTLHSDNEMRSSFTNDTLNPLHHQVMSSTMLHSSNTPPLPPTRDATSSSSWWNRLYQSFQTIKSKIHLGKEANELIYFFFISVILLGVPIKLCIRSFHRGQYQQFCFHLGSCFVFLTLYLSFQEIYNHLKNWYMPDLQKYVIRILFMAPIYSVQSWLSLLNETKPIMVYLEPFRDLYEALVICSFLYYLVALLGGEEEMIATLERKQYHQRHQQNQQYEPLHHLDQEQHTTAQNTSTTTLPMRKYLICQESETATADEFVLQCKQGVLFFVTIKAIAAFLMALLKPLGLYGDETDGTHILDPTRAFLYISTLLNVSMSYALYCLIKLFYAVKEELREPINWRPIGKFLCIKGIVFFTFWQGLVILVLQHYGLFDKVLGNGDGDDFWDSKFVRQQLQSLLICVEMLGFAIAHRFTFTYKEYMVHINDSDDVTEGGMGRHYDDANANGIGNDGNTRPSNGYYAPKLRRLQRPMSKSRAFWSVMPDEEIEDIKRLSRGTSHAVKSEPSFEDLLIEMNDAQSI